MWRPLISSSTFALPDGAIREGGGEVATVAVILDGENAWEYYEGGGRPFLRALYGALSKATDIQTVTMSEAAAGPAQPLRLDLSRVLDQRRFLHLDRPSR